jgi:hypothetical protein
MADVKGSHSTSSWPGTTSSPSATLIVEPYTTE